MFWTLFLVGRLFFPSFFFKVYLERERERERERAGEGQREKERENLKQAPCCEHGTRRRAPAPEP